MCIPGYITIAGRRRASSPQFAYDEAGNITSDTRLGSVYGYAYNNAGRLATVSLAGNVTGTYT